MKLLYITNGIAGAGGLERVLSIKASYLAEQFNYEVTILSLNKGCKTPFYNFSPNIKLRSISVLGNPLQYFIAYKNGLQQIVDEVQPDVISVCDDGLKGFFIPSLVKTKARFIYERHVSKLIEARADHGFLKSLSTKVKWRIMERMAKKFSRFVVLTEGNKQEWMSLKNVEVIPNPLSFYPEKSSALEENTVICVGKISYQKGQDLLVRAWEKVSQKHPDWKLELYGYANEDFLSTETLEQNNIHHFPPEKKIMEKYLKSSIYVMSSRFEGFGMVLIEAMACGVPCVSFDCNYGPSDIITNNEDGILVKKESSKDLAEELIFLIENKELRQKYGKTAKMNVLRFEQNVIAQKWDDLFKRVQEEI